MFGPAVDAAAKSHALSQYPKEACGFVAGAKGQEQYVPLQNIAADPANFFKLPDDALIAHAPVAGVIHSHCHPAHGPAPTAADMESQITAALPFGIVYTDGKAAGAPMWWGDFLLDMPLFNAKGDHIPRQFLHGVNDCFSLIRTWYWQIKKIKLPEFPRDDDWWKNGGNLYELGYSEAGFAPYAKGPSIPHGVETGDVVLMTWGKFKVPFHAGVVMDRGLVLHHPGPHGARESLSRREPLGRWARQITHWLRRQ
jgi:proteasome lid subunit RPN8/RPN11